jgi:hypothetical protein
MKEYIINEFHLTITFLALVVYVILCLISKYIDSSKMNQKERDIAFARIIFGFLSALFLLSLEFRYVTIVYKDNVLLRFVELLICLVLIGLFLYANENKRVAGDRFDIIFKVLNPLIIAFSIMSSGSLNNILNHYKSIV